MHKIDTLNAAVAAPAPKTPGAPGWFDEGDPEVPRDATHLDRDWCNAVQGELTAAIEAAGLALDKNDRTQLLAAWPILARDKLHGFRADPQDPASLSVDVGPGTFYDGPTGLLVAQGTQPAAFVAPTTNPRKDIIHIDARTGAFGVTAGTEAASPVDPALAFGQLPVARVNLTTATTEITAAEIDDIRYLNALGQGSPVFTTPFESAEQSIALSSVTTVAHGLGAVPRLTRCVLRCKTAESGYAVGDEVPMSYFFNSSGLTFGITHGADATNIFSVTGNNALRVHSRSSAGALFSIGIANWRIVLRAWE